MATNGFLLLPTVPGGLVSLCFLGCIGFLIAHCEYHLWLSDVKPFTWVRDLNHFCE